MKPLIYQYAEIVNEEEIIDQTRYCAQLNLNVLKDTNHPAVGYARFSTETFTKAQVDTSDSDDNFYFQFSQFLDTRLNTRSIVDETGSDDDIRSHSLSN
jgi:hypothetical protein